MIGVGKFIALWVTFTWFLLGLGMIVASCSGGGITAPTPVLVSAPPLTTILTCEGIDTSTYWGWRAHERCLGGR